jgi:hypothetical protein
MLNLNAFPGDGSAADQEYQRVLAAAMERSRRAEKTRVPIESTVSIEPLDQPIGSNDKQPPEAS